MNGAVQATSNDPRRRWKAWRRRVVRCCLAAVLLPVVAMLVFELAVRLTPGPKDPAAPPASTLLLDRNGTPLAAFASVDGRWHLPLKDEQISPHLLAALVAVEDARFFDHAGVDWIGAVGALRDNLSRVRPRGASTITMQVYRLREQQSGRPVPGGITGKLKQAIGARQIERTIAKREILIDYANRAPFGGALVGAGAASWRYFGKPCRDLSLGEAALLAGLPQNPNAFRPDRFPDKARARRSHVLRRMELAGLITASQRIEADAEPLTASWRSLPQARSAVPSDGAHAALVAIAGGRAGGQVATSIDGRSQQIAAEMLGQTLNQLAASGVTAGGVVVLDSTTAEVLATVSLEREAAGLRASAVDLVNRPRSTGSVLKPFIYAAAFDAGIATPQTILRDEPTAWAGYTPTNYDRTFSGEMSAGEALARSRNIPAMALLERVGVPRTLGVMESLGVVTPAKSRKSVGLSLAIGGAEATPMEIAQAYACLVRDGQPRLASITPVVDSMRADVGALRPVAARQTIAALADPIRTAALSPEAALSGVAWKTGTSSAHRDAWCASMSRDITVVVWLGCRDGASSAALVGVDAAAPLALRLAVALAPHPMPWPTVPVELMASPARVVGASLVPAARTTALRLIIVSPAPETRVVLDPDMPRSSQRLQLRAAWKPVSLHGPASQSAGDRIHWFVDRTRLATTAADEPMWWTPTPGRHEIRAVDSTGQAAVVSVEVE